MRRALRWLLVVVVVLVVAGVAAYWYERPLLLTGTGYAAHNACALEHISGRSHPEDDLPPNPLVPYLRTSSEGSATKATILGVLAGQKAWYVPGHGCVLADEQPRLAGASAPSYYNTYTTALARKPRGAVRAALARAFGDHLSPTARKNLGTRAVVVLHDGELVAERYAEGFDQTTPQLGWSMSKSVANLAVGRLVRRGKVSLDDARLRGEWRDGRRAITVRNLLQMTSGLEWDETYDLGTPITRMLYLEPDMGGYVAGRPLAHRPGTWQQYSSGSTTLLCSVLARRTGDGVNLVRDTVFRPLGLASAVLEPDAAGTPVCSSYMWATPRDWAAVGQFALDDGVWRGRRLLPPGWMSFSTRAVDVHTDSPGYAAGWWSNRDREGKRVEPELGKGAYFAKGHDGQWIVVVPSAKLVVVRLGFSPEVDDQGVPRLAADLVRALR